MDIINGTLQKGETPRKKRVQNVQKKHCSKKNMNEGASIRDQQVVHLDTPYSRRHGIKECECMGSMG